MPHYAVKARLADKSLQAIFESVTVSPERMHAYFSKAKHLPAKTTDFIDFLQTSIAGAMNARSARLTPRCAPRHPGP